MKTVVYFANLVNRKYSGKIVLDEDTGTITADPNLQNLLGDLSIFVDQSTPMRLMQTLHHGYRNVYFKASAAVRLPSPEQERVLQSFWGKKDSKQPTLFDHIDVE